MILQRYKAEDRVQWDSFNAASKMPLFMFSRDYMEYHKDRFTDNSLMVFDEAKDELIAIFPASLSDGVLSSHGGLTYGGFIIGNSVKQHTINEIFVELIKYAKEKGIGKVIYKTIPHIYHKQGAEEDIYALFLNNARILKIEPATVITLNDLLKMPKGRKAQIGRARREGVEVKESEDFGSFIALENSVLAEYHGTKAVHSGEELSYLKSCFPERIRLFVALFKGQMIAGTVLYEYENVIHTQYMAANEMGREIGALDLTIATIIEDYKDRKAYLDFGISSEENGRILNEGLISQKEGFGGRTNVYTTWEMTI